MNPLPDHRREFAPGRAGRVDTHGRAVTPTSARTDGPYARYLPAVVLVLLTAGYVSLAGNTLSLATVQYDEFTDLVISSRLSDHPLTGHRYDPSQGRLPMYVTGLAYRILKTFDQQADVMDVLLVSRSISILMIVLAIWSTALLGARLFDRTVGLTAAALFAFSPLVLHFGRDALTQGDAFTPSMVLLTLIAFERFDRQRTTESLSRFAFCAGLMIASKFTLGALLPALATYHIVVDRRVSRYQAGAHADSATSGLRMFSPTYLVLAVATGGAVSVAVALAQVGTHSTSPSPAMQYLALAAWLVTLVGLLGVLVLSSTSLPRPRWLTVDVRWGAGWSWLALGPLVAATALALFPEHIFNTSILREVVDRAATRDGGGHPFLPTFLASARLYAGLLLFKLGLPFGIATFSALGWAAVTSRRDRSVLLISLLLVFYGLMLAVLPLQQPFWIVSVYPLLLLLLSTMLVRSLRSQRLAFRSATAAGVTVAVGWLIVGLIRVYPAFGLYGYETTGDRWLGASSRGYRALVVTTNDGSVETIEWLRKNAPTGSRVLSYLDDRHLIRYLQNTRPFPFEYLDALSFPQADVPASLIAAADFAVVRAVDDQGFPLPDSQVDFVRHFGKHPVYEIVRGRGIYRMAVYRIYESIPKRVPADVPRAK